MTDKLLIHYLKYWRSRRTTLMGQGVILLLVLQCAIAFTSWMLSAIAPNAHVCSLLSGNGIRWLCGQFTLQLASPVLVWLLFMAVAYGALKRCGICQVVCRQKPLSYRQKMAMRFVVSELIGYIVATVLLAFVPHAILLGIDGRLFPSAFSHSLIPQLSGVLTIMALTYGYITENISKASHLYEALTQGIVSFAPVFLYYILCVQIISSFSYAFCFNASL